MNNALKAQGRFIAQCRDANGRLKWETMSPNLVVNTGLQDMNTKYFTGVSYTAMFYMGLYGPAASNTPAPSDTVAVHPGWTEIVPYSNSSRPNAVFSAASLADPSVISGVAAFNINATATVGGAFLVTGTGADIKNGTTGILFSAADFLAPGDRGVAYSDTLSVTYQFSLNAL